MKCANCGATLGCGCQKRTSKSGKACCAKCVDSENAKYDSSKKPLESPVKHTVVSPKK